MSSGKWRPFCPGLNVLMMEGDVLLWIPTATNLILLRHRQSTMKWQYNPVLCLLSVGLHGIHHTHDLRHPAQEDQHVSTLITGVLKNKPMTDDVNCFLKLSILILTFFPPWNSWWGTAFQIAMWYCVRTYYSSLWCHFLGRYMVP